LGMEDHKNSVKAKVQITTEIVAPKEAIVEVIGRLSEEEELISLENETSKLASFKLRGDSSSMLQVSPEGKVIFTVTGSSSFQRLYRSLVRAMFSAGLSGHCLGECEAIIYRVEKYRVGRLEDVDSLVIAQTILGSRKPVKTHEARRVSRGVTMATSQGSWIRACSDLVASMKFRRRNSEPKD